MESGSSGTARFRYLGTSIVDKIRSALQIGITGPAPLVLGLVGVVGLLLRGRLSLNIPTSINLHD